MGGRVNCLDALCPKQIIETFALPLELQDLLFNEDY
jgi:hypothetical protein